MVSNLPKRWCNKYGKAEILLVLPLPFVMIFISLLIGPTQTLSAWDYLRWVVQAVFGTPYFDAEQFGLMQNILVNVRLPRILLTFMVGAALATAGNGLQALFRNPWSTRMYLVFHLVPRLVQLWHFL